MAVSEINIEQLLKPISKENPIGEKLPIYDLTTMAEGEPKRQWAPAVPPNWKNVYRTSQKYLKQGKDLWAVHFLARSAMELYEFDGLIKGLDLLKQMLEKYWDDIPPLLDPNAEEDYEFCVARLSTISSLCAKSQPLYQKIVSMPLIKTTRLGNFSFMELQGMADELGTRKKEHEGIELNHIYAEVKGEYLDNLLSQFTRCHELLSDIDKFVDEKVSPEFNRGRAKELGGLFDEMKTFFKENLMLSTGQFEDSEGVGKSKKAGADSEEGPAAMKKARRGQLINSEKDVVKVFNEVSRWYNENLPTSPIPYILSQANELVGKDFLESVAILMENKSLKIKTSFNAKLESLQESSASSQKKSKEKTKDKTDDGSGGEQRGTMPPGRVSMGKAF